jgi:hypothetical protein
VELRRGNYWNLLFLIAENFVGFSSIQCLQFIALRKEFYLR